MCGERSEWGSVAQRAERAAGGERGGAGTCFSKRGNNELPFYLAVWLAGDVGDVVAGPPGITAPVGAHGRGAEGQRRAVGEHRSCAAEELTCRCVDFRDHDVVPARARHGGSKKKRSSAGTSQKGWGRPTSNRRGAGARALPGVSRRHKRPGRRHASSPVRKIQGFLGGGWSWIMGEEGRAAAVLPEVKALRWA